MAIFHRSGGPSSNITWSNKLGPYIGYFPKPTKSFLIVKENYINEANAIFSNTQIQITTRGNRYPGAIIGDEAYKNEYVNNKVNECVERIINLTGIAKTHSHSAYSAFTHGLQHKYTYVMRTIPDISNNPSTIRKCDKKGQITPHIVKRVHM